MGSSKNSTHTQPIILKKILGTGMSPSILIVYNCVFREAVGGVSAGHDVMMVTGIWAFSELARIAPQSIT